MYPLILISNPILIHSQVIKVIKVLMKKSDEFGAPASFFKKNSHIVSNNGGMYSYNTLTPTYNSQFNTRDMHRSQFNIQQQNKFLDILAIDQDLQDLHSEGNDKNNQGDKSKEEHRRQQFDFDYQSEDISSEQSNSNSQTNSSKKFILGNNMSEKLLKSVKSQQEQKYLVINSKKQKKNNYLFSDDVDAIKHEIKKYEISIEKLKEENLKLRSQKIKMSSNNSSMQIIQYRLQLESVKKKIKQLQAEKQMHSSINGDINGERKTEGSVMISQLNLNQNSNNNHYMTHSCLQNSSSNTDRNEMKQQLQKRSIPTFRQNQQKQTQIVFDNLKEMNSVKGKSQHEDGANSNYKILKNMKSPYFLKKY